MFWIRLGTALKSFINEDKYQYLDSLLKHARTHTHTCLMVLHTNVQQSPGSHFTVVDSGTSMHTLQYRLLTSNLSEDSQATCLKIMQSFLDSVATYVGQHTEVTSAV